MKPKTIAWIEDDTPIIFSVVEPLKKAGHRIEVFHSVDEAIEGSARLEASDLILLDVLGPPGREDRYPTRYTGLHLLEELRKEHQVKTPVVLFSVVRPSAEWQKRYEELGIVEYIRKPVLPSELKRKVEDVLEAISG